MKLFTFVVIVTIGLSVGLFNAAAHGVSKSVVDNAMLSQTHTGKEANDINVHQKQTFMHQQGWGNSEICEPVQSERDLMTLFAQARKKICITPSGSCKVKQSAPIDSSCCCRRLRVCGSVVWE